MATLFYSRREKARMGFRCQEASDGSLWVGKAKELSLLKQIGRERYERVRKALTRWRRNRRGAFWLDLENEELTMQYGTWKANKTRLVSF